MRQKRERRKHPFIGETICFVASMLMLAKFVNALKPALMETNFASMAKLITFLCLTVLGIFATGFFSYQRYKLIGRVRKEIKIYERILGATNRKIIGKT